MVVHAYSELQQVQQPPSLAIYEATGQRIFDAMALQGITQKQLGILAFRVLGFNSPSSARSYVSNASHGHFALNALNERKPQAKLDRLAALMYLVGIGEGDLIISSIQKVHPGFAYPPLVIRDGRAPAPSKLEERIATLGHTRAA